MSRVNKIIIVSSLILMVLVVSGVYLSQVSIPILQPRGYIADQEFRLLITVTLLMLIIVIPVFVLLAYIMYKFRDTNHKPKKYSPNWANSKILEPIWWLIPSMLILVIGIITWHETYALNPYKPIASKHKAIVVQVVSLDWKWLFIYPQFKIASVNQLVFPVNTPVHFYITSAAPMNSLWIPQLAGQMYAMAGMRTQLNIMASVKGVFKGRSANISGAGFDSMVFNAISTSKLGFNQWIDKASFSPSLSLAAYKQLEKPTSFVKPYYYSNPAPNLFNDIMFSYMAPKNELKKMGFSYV